MVLFWPVQQELDCINVDGCILGKIKFDSSKEAYVFYPVNESIILSSIEESSIAEKVSGLNSGIYSIPMQDDD